MKTLTKEETEIIVREFDQTLTETETSAVKQGYSTESIVTIYTMLQKRIDERIKLLQK